MNRSPLKLVAVACAVALSLPLAGCGKDDDKTPEASATSTLPPDVARYVADAEKICTDSRVDIAEVQADVPEKPSPAELTSLLGRIADILDVQIGKLKELSPPDAIRSEVDAWLVSFTAAAKKTRTQTEASIRKANQPGGKTVFGDTDGQAEAIGVKKCRTDYVPE